MILHTHSAGDCTSEIKYQSCSEWAKDRALRVGSSHWGGQSVQCRRVFFNRQARPAPSHDSFGLFISRYFQITSKYEIILVDRLNGVRFEIV